MRFAQRINGIEPSGIRKILDLAAGARNPVDMSIGQPDFDVPDEIKGACIGAIKEGFNRYTQSVGLPELRERILSSQRQRGMVCEDVMVTVGAAGAMTLFFLALVDAGDEVVITDPYFLNYRHLITLTGAVPRFIETYPDFRLREEEVWRAVTPKTRLIVLNSPGNPTGMVYTRREIDWVVEAAKKWNCWILSDEVYDRFVYDGRNCPSPAMAYEKTLVVSSFSKSSGMPGWRLGYGTGPKRLIQEIIPLQQYLYGCAPSAAQKAGILCMERDINADRARLERKRDLVYNGLKDHYRVEKPQGAFYLFPQAPRGDCYRFIERALKANVFVSPGDTFSRRNSHFRISYAIPEEALKRGLGILRNLVSEPG
ncbi:MAG: pyridoxal phosphate-dependent aminotransferase [Acidobacteriota bacterium]